MITSNRGSVQFHKFNEVLLLVQDVLLQSDGAFAIVLSKYDCNGKVQALENSN